MKKFIILFLIIFLAWAHFVQADNDDIESWACLVLSEKNIEQRMKKFNVILWSYKTTSERIKFKRIVNKYFVNNECDLKNKNNYIIKKSLDIHWRITKEVPKNNPNIVKFYGYDDFWRKIREVHARASETWSKELNDYVKPDMFNWSSWIENAIIKRIEYWYLGASKRIVEIRESSPYWTKRADIFSKVTHYFYENNNISSIEIVNNDRNWLQINKNEIVIFRNDDEKIEMIRTNEEKYFLKVKNVNTDYLKNKYSDFDINFKWEVDVKEFNDVFMYILWDWSMIFDAI